MSPNPRSPSCSQGLSAFSNERSTAMPTMLPTWTAEASIYPRSPYSYCAPATGFPSAWPQSLSQVGQVAPFVGRPCGTCGPCLPDENSRTGCTQICWNQAPPRGDCDTYDRACHDPGCRPTCQPGERLCGTTCVSVASDPSNCGGCGSVCPPGSTCCGGSCCSSGFCCTYRGSVTCGGCAFPGTTSCCPSGKTCNTVSTPFGPARFCWPP
jgi:hypothetical protein